MGHINDCRRDEGGAGYNITTDDFMIERFAPVTWLCMYDIHKYMYM